MTSAPPAYNLLDEPWIPVRWIPVRWIPGQETNDTANSATTYPPKVGLRELLLRAHEIEQIEIAVPPALSALYRILYAITARVTELDEAGPGDWSERRDDLVTTGSFGEEQVARYVTPIHGRFDLFDAERPFLQDPRLVDQCDPANTAGVDKLITTRPSGNNHSWFVHVNSTAPELPTPDQAVLHLLVWHYYGPSGRCSSRTVGGTKAAGSKAGPLRSTLSYHPEGETLFETLLAGLPEPVGGVSRDSDLCPWERDELPDPVAAPPPLKGPCSELTARSQHALLLVPDTTGAHVEDAFITWANQLKVSREGDLYLIWQTSKEGNPYPRPADSRRALWRDLDALLLNDPAGSARPRRPEVFRTAPEVSEKLRVRAWDSNRTGRPRTSSSSTRSPHRSSGSPRTRNPPSPSRSAACAFWGSGTATGSTGLSRRRGPATPPPPRSATAPGPSTPRPATGPPPRPSSGSASTNATSTAPPWPSASSPSRPTTPSPTARWEPCAEPRPAPPPASSCTAAR